MLKQIMLNKKLEQARSSLKGMTDKETQFQTRSEELTTVINDAKTDEEVKAAEEKVSELEKEKSELAESKGKIESNIKEIEEELENYNSKKPDNTKRSNNSERNGAVTQEVRSGIANYIRSKGHERAGFTSVEGGALIPKELLKLETDIQDRDIVDLSKLIRNVPVQSGSGSYPVIKKSGSKMHSVAELDVNPELAKPTISDVDYKIQTYRGYIPISQEAIDDADYDVVGLIADEIKDQELNTKNSMISAVLKTATPKAIVGLDGIKKAFNIDMKKVYNTKAIVSSSLFNELDTTKDANGRYLLKDDITTASGKKLFGREVVVLDDDIIGTASGDMVGFIGDPKEFAALFDRKKSSVKWTDHMVYGELLAGFVRFDVKKTDSDAGYYVTYTREVPTP